MILSILAFIALILSICIKDREKSLGVQSLNCLFEAMYSFTINAFTGAFLSIINFIRLIYLCKVKKLKETYMYLYLLCLKALLF